MKEIRRSCGRIEVFLGNSLSDVCVHFLGRFGSFEAIQMEIFKGSGSMICIKGILRFLRVV
jgi:hypothetical protein